MHQPIESPRGGGGGGRQVMVLPGQAFEEVDWGVYNEGDDCITEAIEVIWRW